MAQEVSMQRYSEFRPTAFDAAGAFIGEERGRWLVAPCSRTRDSGPLDESNFDAFLEGVGGESATVEVHRFGHWGPGWFEIILIEPGTTAEQKALELEKALENYPVLDDDDFSEREHETALETWAQCYTLRERVKLCQEYGASVFAARRTDEYPSECFDHFRG